MKAEHGSLPPVADPAPTTAGPAGSPTARTSPGADSGAPLPCGSWIADGSLLAAEIAQSYSPVLDCEAVPGAWVLTTESGQAHASVIGVARRSGACSADVPTAIGDWRFVAFSRDVTRGNRVGGLTASGAIVFTGASGEATYDPVTGTFSKPPTFSRMGAPQA